MNPNDTIPNLEEIEDSEVKYIDVKHYEAVVKQRDEYQADIVFTAQMISRLLLDIGLFNDEMELQPISRVLRKLPGMLINQSSLVKKFEYLGELGGIIEKYSANKTIIDKP